MTYVKNNDVATEVFDFDELEEMLQKNLEEELSGLDFLKREQEIIGNPENLGNVIKNVVWEQFVNQIAVTAGKDFIKENKGLTLDVREEAHIQTADNFAVGKIATHNYLSKDKIEQNYDRYINIPHKEFRDEFVDKGMDVTLKRAGELKKEGIDYVKDIYTGRQISTSTKLENGENNSKAAQREHVMPSAEIYKNPSLQMANDSDELADVINHPENLQGYTTAERNLRKSDKSSCKMDERDKTKHWEEANSRAEKYIQDKEQSGEKRLRNEGEKTREEEAFRIGGKALRAVIMRLLAELVKEIIVKLVKWFKSAKRKLETFLESLKEAIHSFVNNLKTHIFNAVHTLTDTIVTSIVGPIWGTIKKVWILLKQGWKSLREAVAYIKSPVNGNKPIGILLMETGKIIIAGLAGAGAIVLSEVIEKGLLTVPVFAVEIPMIGSLANICGIFFGAVTAGIIGAIAINIIEKKVEKQKKAENIKMQIAKGNEVLVIQDQLLDVSKEKLNTRKDDFRSDINKRHKEAQKEIHKSLSSIFDNKVKVNSDKDFAEMDALLDSLSFNKGDA
ncbi:MAG: hypothetical protein IJV92_04765 [Phascolarctobacterium sp.]|nr:hypothetical protein [Phascolarctobacterium sp.]